MAVANLDSGSWVSVEKATDATGVSVQPGQYGVYVQTGGATPPADVHGAFYIGPLERDAVAIPAADTHVHFRSNLPTDVVYTFGGV